MTPNPQIPEDFAAKLRVAREKRTMQGERRVVSILFTDVKGSSAMAGKLDPEDWAEVMNEAFEYLVAPIYRYEGTVARLMGDAVLAFFGAPVAHEDDPVRAVRAGLDILEGIQPFCQRIRDQYRLDFNVRVGINTGPVVVGEIGSDLAMEYTAMGDAANLAARMEETAQPGTLQVSEHTYRLVTPVFHAEHLGKLEAKGISDRVHAYRIIGPKDSPGRLRGIEGLKSPLVGRSKEFEVAKANLDHLEKGRGGVLTLLGEAGLGKTRLIEEMKSLWVNGNPSHGWTESRALSYDMGKPYSLFIEHIRSFLEIRPVDTPEVARQKIADSLHDYSEDQRQLVQHAVELLLSVTDESSDLVVEGEAIKREVTESLLTSWRQAFGENPMVVVFDDLHWADSTSIEVLGSLLQLADEIPILFICSMRPHRGSHGWQIKLKGETDYPHRYAEIDLSPLTSDDSDKLISNLLSIAELPEGTRDLILSKAEGNPLFVEEVIRTLIDSNAIIRDEVSGIWKATGAIDKVDLPDNLQALLISRIDRLEQEIRRTLQLAAVIGRSFYFRILQRITEAADALKNHMNTLQRVQLIQEEARIPELKYMFSHELTRDAAYHTILKRERRRFHQQVGEAIETLFPDKLEEEAHVLAVHFREAGDDERALKYFTLAGDAAARVYANAEAISHYTHAIELALRLEHEDVQIIDLFRHRGRAYEVSGLYEQALANYEELEQLGKSKGKPRLQIAGLVAQGTIYTTPNTKMDMERGQEFSEGALRLAEKNPDPHSESKAYWNLMNVTSGLGGSAQAAIDFGERSLAIAREHGLDEQAAFTLHDLATPYFLGSSQEKALQALSESRRLWQELNNQPMLADNLISTSLLAMMWGQPDRAEEYSRQGLELSRKIGNLWGQSYSLMTLGWVQAEVGQPSASIRSLTESAELAPKAGFLYAVATDSLFMGWEYSVLGHAERGREMLERVASVEISLEELEVLRKLFRAYFRFQEGDLEGAKSMLSGITFDQEPGALSGPPTFFGTVISAEIELAAQNYQEAFDRSTRISDTMERLGIRFLLPDILFNRGRALVGLKRVEEGLQQMHAAFHLAEEIGSLRALHYLLPESIDLERRHGSAERAQELESRAVEVYQFIADHIEDEDLMQHYLAAPNTRRFLQG